MVGKSEYRDIRPIKTWAENVWRKHIGSKANERYENWITGGNMPTDPKARWKDTKVYFHWLELAARVKDSDFRCEKCRMELDFSRRTKREQKVINSPTMDRIDPLNKEMYLKDIQILCYQCNAAKSDFSTERWIEHTKVLNSEFKKEQPELYNQLRDSYR